MVRGVTYDAGALIAAERGVRSMWAIHHQVLTAGRRPTVPAAVLAQVWRGGPQAQLSRLLRGCQVEVLDEARARAVGRLCGVAGSADVVDAAVVVGAIERGDLVVTSDPDDLRRLGAAAGRDLGILAV